MAVLIAGYKRTPFVKFNGMFAHLSAVDLGAHAIAAALVDAGIAPEGVDIVVGGQVLQAGAGQNPARQSAVKAGIPLTTPAMTLNAVCLSGMLAVAEGVALIETGRADVVVALGQESMSRAPHAGLSRTGQRFGAIELIDTLEHDGLTDAFESRSMGASTQDFADAAGITRADQDDWAARSHRLAAASQGGVFAEEIAPLEVTVGRESRTVDSDDGIRAETTAAVLARLRPAFSRGGTITAGNASPITDGAAAIVLVRDSVALSRMPLGLVRSHALVAGPDVSLLDQPARAIKAAMERTDARSSELDVVEINEAFAAVAVASVRTLGVETDLVNPTGGAIALGHPIGASGTRIVGTLARRLKGLGAGSLGAAAICGGGGQGAAVIIESL